MRNLMSFQAKRELVQQVAPRYHEATAKEKEAILTEFAAITRYARKYAIVLLDHPPGHVEAMHRVRVLHYGPEVQAALVLAWNTANRICAKRLVPFLPVLIKALERHGHLHLTDEVRTGVLTLRPATSDRLLLLAPTYPGSCAVAVLTARLVTAKRLCGRLKGG